MEKINYAYIGLAIFIMFTIIVLIIFADWKDIEKLRANNLDLYSKQLQWVQLDIERKEKQVEVIKEQITELKGTEDWLISCLKLNSEPWVLVDCDLYFNKPKNEEEGSASGSDANKVSE